jgi:hypothetical protein
MVKMWHPDRFSKDSSLHKTAEESFMQVTDAYERLRSSMDAGNAKEPGGKDGSGPVTGIEGPEALRFQTIPASGKHKKLRNTLIMWACCILPLVGPALWRIFGSGDLRIDPINAKVLISICFLCYSCFFLIETMAGGRHLQALLYWLVMIWYLTKKVRIKVRRDSEKAAFVSQLNILFTVLFLLGIAKGIQIL